MCTAAEVEVDPEVGMVDVVRLVLASDINGGLYVLRLDGLDLE